jgi:putative ABC transport system permease protein
VTGVCADVPSNTHFHFNMFGSLRSTELRDTWLTSGITTYIVLQPGYSINQLEAKIPELVKNHIGTEVQQLLGMSLSEF